MIRNESEILNVGMSKPPKVASRPAGVPRGAISGPAGYEAVPRGKKFVSLMKKNMRKISFRERESMPKCVSLTTVVGRDPTFIQPVDQRVLY